MHLHKIQFGCCEVAGGAIWIPTLIGLSCLFTKQHYLFDVQDEAALGRLDHRLYLRDIAA
jgi:hypothetical protein